jgi:TatA/E family protein of Tat protein translocase
MAMLGIFSLGGGEIILGLALVVILFGANKLPDLARGLGKGIWLFRDAVDDAASEAGRSVGGIYGKPAAQALTPDNTVAELYRPRVFENGSGRRKRRTRLLRRLLKLWLKALRCLEWR